MGTTIRIQLLFVLCCVPFSVEAEAKNLFVCDDGSTVLLTDQASHGCPTFIPQAELFVVPDGATWADVEWAVASRRPEAFQPRSAPALVTFEEACAQWRELTLRTSGGLLMRTPEETRRLLTLSKIVSATICADGTIVLPVRKPSSRALRTPLNPGG